MLDDETIDLFRVDPGEKAGLKKRDPAWDHTPDLKELGKDEAKESARRILDENLRNLAQAQETLYAGDRHAVLVILQGMDASGKDGTIKHVMSGLNPQGCQVHSFKEPSAEELDHDFLWRYSRNLPERGRIGIFNRSHYEEVAVVRVHPEILERQKLPPGKRGKKFWKGRFDDINAFETHLARNGTLVLKFFLHLSKEEQKRRLLERIDRPDKNWKFSAKDVAERARWDDYEDAYEEALTATSTRRAPWYVVPADHKWVARTVVADVIASAIAGLGLRYPEIDDEQRQALAEAKRQLESE